jgi:hypothetical protein
VGSVKIRLGIGLEKDDVAVQRLADRSALGRQATLTSLNAMTFVEGVRRRHEPLRATIEFE